MYKSVSLLSRNRNNVAYTGKRTERSVTFDAHNLSIIISLQQTLIIVKTFDFGYSSEKIAGPRRIIRSSV